MISKNKLKELRQLDSKKHRREKGLFVAEGPKVVGDLLDTFTADTIAATPEWWDCHPDATSREHIVLTPEELDKLSFLQHPQQVFATFPLPSQSEEDMTSMPFEKDICLALDGIQDPGNLGTIIRIADWFGIKTIYCSQDTADAFSPKVVQATMGSISRVRMIYTDLCQMLDTIPATIPVYGTMLDGDDLYSTPITSSGLLVMGNEGNGISSYVAKRLTHKLLIPPYPAGNHKADSLNVGMATAICCAEFRRRCK